MPPTCRPCSLGSASPKIHSGRMDLHQVRPPSVGPACRAGPRGLPRPVRRGSQKIALAPVFARCCQARSVRLRRKSIPAEWTYIESRRLATHGRPERCTSFRITTHVGGERKHSVCGFFRLSRIFTHASLCTQLRRQPSNKGDDDERTNSAADH